MELSQKLQELRKQKALTQEELADILFVSRTAISKWESGRGYPSIDSLKAIAEYFEVSIDELLSGKELIAAAENDGRQKMQHVYDIAFGMLDCSMAILLFLPIFGKRLESHIYQVPLFQLTNTWWYLIIPYFAIIFITILFGVAVLALQNCSAELWVKYKRAFSLFLSICACVMFMISQQPYAAVFVFLFLLIKGSLLIKHK